MEESLGSNQSKQGGLFAPFHVRQARMKGLAGRNHCLQMPLRFCHSCADHALIRAQGWSKPGLFSTLALADNLPSPSPGSWRAAQSVGATRTDTQ